MESRAPRARGMDPHRLRAPSRWFVSLLASLLGGCGLGSSNTYPDTAPVRTATDLPPAFALTDSTARAPAPAAFCVGRLRDPRDDTQLVLRSSQGGVVGDYEVPVGRYGVGTNEYLRVDCRTLRALGAVPRRG
jgi:hypothetical protein